MIYRLLGQMDYLYFVYGLAGFLLTLVCLSLSQRSGKRLSWCLLGIFGLLQGVNEWLSIVLMGLGYSEPLKWTGLLILGLSFLVLLKLLFYSSFQSKCFHIFPLARLSLIVLLSLVMAGVLLAAAFGMANSNRVVEQVQFWNGIVVGVLALALGIYSLITWDRFKVYWLPVVSGVICAAAVLTAGAWLTNASGKNETNRQRDMLLSLAQQAAIAINVDNLKDCAVQEDALNYHGYQRLRHKLITLRDIASHVRVYLIHRVNNGAVYLADSGLSGGSSAAMFGAIYEADSAILQEVFATGKAHVSDNRSDHRKFLVSIYTPLFDSRTGNVLAVLCIDRDIKGYIIGPAMERLKVIGLMAVLFLAVFLSFTYHLRYGALLTQLTTGEEIDSFLHWGTAGIVIMVGLSLTLFAFVNLKHSAWGDYVTTFMQRAMGRASVISQALNDQTKLMAEFKLYYENVSTVGRVEFSQYVSQLIKGVPVRAVEWIPRVQLAEKDEYERSTVVGGGQANYIKEMNASGQMVRVSAREEYFPVSYIEPVLDNEAFLGVDQSADPLRKAAMDKARDLGIAVATEAISLDQASKENKGVQLFMPVYKAGSNPQTVAERRQDLRGFVAGVYSSAQFIKIAISNMPAEGLPYLVEDVAAQDDGRVLYRHIPRAGAVDWHSVSLKLVMPMNMADREWRITVVPGTAFLKSNHSLGYLIVWPVGLFITALVAIFLNMLMLSRYRAKLLVRVRTAELKQSEESYRRQFLDSSAVMILIDPVDGRILEANRSAIGFYGYSDVQLQSMKIIDIDTLPQSEVDKALKEIIAGTERRFEFQHRLKDGVIKNVEVLASPIFFNGKIVIHSIIHDITKRKIAEGLLREAQQDLEKKVQLRTEELDQANLELRVEIGEHQVAIEELHLANRKADEANQLKSQFVATVSHEMRTPLNGIIGFAELIERAPDLTRVKEMSRTIINESETLLALVNDILDRAKIEAGKLSLSHEVFDIRKLMSRICKPFELRLAGKNVTLGMDIADDVPLLIMTDPLRLVQIITNLVNNAIKFTEQGSVKVKIVKVSEKDGRVCLRVEVVDTGVGIPEDKQHLIFERFAQVDGELSRRFGGIGLGVSIAKGLVDLMGGQIGFESCYGSGTTFWFTINADLPREDQMPVADQAVQSFVEGGRGRVLVAEDYVPNQEIARMHLESAGYGVTVASNGKIVIEICSREEFQLILMDIQMPGMDGYETTRVLRQMGGWLKAVPIIGFTANAEHKTLEECLGIGMNGVIVKPIRRTAFLAEVGKWANMVLSKNAAIVEVSPVGKAAVLSYDEAVQEFAGNAALLNEVIAKFLLQVRRQLVNIDQALQSNDLASIGREAHKIKGAAGNLTALRLADLARDIEMKSKANDNEGLAEQVAQLRQEVAELERFMENKSF